MTRVVPHEDVSWTVFEGANWNDSREYSYSTGVIRTKLGLVDVYRQWGDHPVTMLEIVYGGKTYRRRWDECYSKRYCVTLAKRFIRGHQQ